MNNIWLHIIFIIAGFFILTKSSDWFVEGASTLARKLKIPIINIQNKNCQ